MISIIVAHSKNQVIGKDGQLPWKISDDLKRFKELTTGHSIIMGRKTFESIGRPLPNRTNIVITRQADYNQPGVISATSIEEAIHKAGDDSEVFIIGGGEIYTQAIEYADKAYVTYINQDIDGDTFFPELNLDYWQLDNLVPHSTDDGLHYYFADFSRRENKPKLYYIDEWRTLEQVAQMEDLEKRGVCVFCEKHFKAEHREPIEIETEHWLVTKNDYPYPNTKLHLLIVPKEHVSVFADLSKEAQNEYGVVLCQIEQHFNQTSYSQFMRAGDFRYTGASIFHLHAHVIAADHENKKFEKIRVKLGTKPKSSQAKHKQ